MTAGSGGAPFSCCARVSEDAFQRRGCLSRQLSVSGESSASIGGGAAGRWRRQQHLGSAFLRCTRKQLFDNECYAGNAPQECYPLPALQKAQLEGMPASALQHKNPHLSLLCTDGRILPLLCAAKHQDVVRPTSAKAPEEEGSP